MDLAGAKISHLELLVQNFLIWNCWCENFRIWLFLVRNFCIRERWCEIFASENRWCEIFTSAWCSCLQMAITSSFQLRFAHRFKRWTSDFPSFEKIYSMHIMDSRKCSKFFLQLLSFWISHSMRRFRIAMRNCFMLDFSLWFSSLHLLIGLETYFQGFHKILSHFGLLQWSKTTKNTKTNQKLISNTCKGP